MDAKLFDDDINQILNTARVNLVFPASTLFLTKNFPKTFVNVSDAQVRGFETQVKYRLFKQTQIIANFSHINVSSDQSKLLLGGFTLSTGTNNFSALVTHQFDNNWDASLPFTKQAQ